MLSWGALFTADRNSREETEERGLRYLGHAGELHPVVPVVAAHDARDEDLQKEERTRSDTTAHTRAHGLHMCVCSMVKYKVRLAVHPLKDKPFNNTDSK